jgi:hypothetical protein
LNRFNNINLNETANPVTENNLYELSKPVHSNSEMKNESLIVFDTDLLIEQYKENYKNIFIVHLENDQRKIKLSENVINFKKNLVDDTCS